MLSLTQATLYYWNVGTLHHRAAVDSALLGRVQDWASKVDSPGKKVPSQGASITSKRSAASALSSPAAVSAMVSSSINTSSERMTVDLPKVDLVGRFDDEEMEDDTFERLAVGASDACETSQNPVSYLLLCPHTDTYSTPLG